MSNFEHIPYEDIVEFLKFYQMPVPNNRDEAYNVAHYLLSSLEDGSFVPLSISNFVVAETLLKRNVDIDPISASYIKYASDDELQPLVKLFGLKINEDNRNRIIEILSYMNKISYIEDVPEDILNTILETMDCRDIIKSCEVSNVFNRYCNEPNIDLLRRSVTKSSGMNAFDYQLNALSSMCRTRYYNTIDVDYNNITIIRDGGHQIWLMKHHTDYLVGDGQLIEISKLGSNDAFCQIKRHYPGKYALLSCNGDVYTLNSDEGELIPLNIKNIIQIECIDFTLAMLASDGSVYIHILPRGFNIIFKHLSHGTNKLKELKNITKISISHYHFIALDNNGITHMYGYGRRDHKATEHPAIINKIIQIENDKKIKDVFSHGLYSILIDVHNNIHILGEFGKKKIKSDGYEALINIDAGSQIGYEYIFPDVEEIIILKENGNIYIVYSEDWMDNVGIGFVYNALNSYDDQAMALHIFKHLNRYYTLVESNGILYIMDQPHHTLAIPSYKTRIK